jgi:hypothetical protein
MWEKKNKEKEKNLAFVGSTLMFLNTLETLTIFVTLKVKPQFVH